MTTATLDPSTLAQFSGSEHWIAHPLLGTRFVHTDGMDHVAETAGAYWLIDAAASYQGPGLDRVCDGFQVWQLRKLGDTCKNDAELTCWRDTPGDGKPVIRQLIPFTDFPFDGSGRFVFWVEGTRSHRWTALLPSEH